MTEAMLLADLDGPKVGDQVAVTGDEGIYAVLVRRIRKGDQVVVSNGIGSAVRGAVLTADVNGLTVEVSELLAAELGPVRFNVALPLVKGEPAESALEMLTELGVDEIVPWLQTPADGWASERVERALSRWRSVVRDATKNAHRFWVPRVSPPLTTAELAVLIGEPDLAVVLDQHAQDWFAPGSVPTQGEVLVIVGPDEGLTADELHTFEQAGGRRTRVAEAALRPPTAAAVALGQLQAFSRA